MADDIDYHLLAERAALTGGHIREAAITAAVEASAAGEPVTMARVFDAIAREYDKLGKVFSARDFLLTEAE
ncbi:hypothetical protein ASE86_11290 [Sphingomonas sp. Leaf33]|uniref:hypothetical protein n=1 Tax=Sphingomonas sp. Leaf33 TaxID=1736215 RepID=UPI0006F5EBBC|nr:hypothetical protein [Sphingomonas sp. Leaf33]KQN26649.1 hypothetical protein ASE86_11290 [Sphingomonas sp. Leaf33]